MGPLDGLRILDLTSVLMGPYATSILGDMGADVIKLESPQGDMTRHVGPSRSGAMGGMFMHANRSKRSIVVDLKSTDGLQVALRLAKKSDILIYNVRPQAMARLGLGYDDVATVNPGIIYVGAFGFGQDGPYAARPAYDDLIQGISTVPHLLAETGDGTPRYVSVNIAYRIVGLHVVNAVLAAVRHRDKTGRGQKIDVPMFETMASFVLGDHLGGLSYRPPLDQGGYARLLARNRKPYRTSDGHLCVLLYTDKHWRDFFTMAGRPEKLDDPRFASHPSRLAHIDAIYLEVAELMRGRTTAEWIEKLIACDIPHTPAHTLTSIMDDPHLRAVGFFQEAEHPAEGDVVSMRVASTWSDSQPRPERLAPLLGEHTREILAEIGCDDAETERLIAGGAVAQLPPGD